MSAEQLHMDISANVFKSQIDAVDFLIGRGFKVSKSSFNRDVKAGKVSTDLDGNFPEVTLLAYANALKAPTAKHEDKKLVAASKEKISHEARLKQFQADRLELKLKKERGQSIDRVEYERDLAARALFFKQEVSNFIFLQGAGIIHLVSGDQDKLQELERFWDEATADWMNAWSEERQFVIGEDDDEESEE